MVSEITCWKCGKEGGKYEWDERWITEDGHFRPPILYRVYVPGQYYYCGECLNAEMERTGKVAMFSLMGFRLVTPEEAARLEGTRVGGYLEC